eukprot:GHVR01015884.1.p1 GENE.GHVR01015884.1~~GHVR01015884.1.p1  ORF type:complete len:824 (-),score=111.03 GHVR01015884.1:2728-5199(-)
MVSLKALALSLCCFIPIHAFWYLKPPNGDKWHSDKVGASEELQVIFGLPHRNEDELERLALAVSDPLNSEYGKHLNLKQLRERFSPIEDSLQRVVSFVKEYFPNSQPHVVKSGDFITFKVTAGDLAVVLKTDFSTYSENNNSVDLESSRGVVATSDIYIPTEIVNYLQFVLFDTPKAVVFHGQKYEQATNHGIRMGKPMEVRETKPDVGNGQEKLNGENSIPQRRMSSTENPNEHSAIVHRKAPVLSEVRSTDSVLNLKVSKMCADGSTECTPSIDCFEISVVEDSNSEDKFSQIFLIPSKSFGEDGNEENQLTVTSVEFNGRVLSVSVRTAFVDSTKSDWSNTVVLAFSPLASKKLIRDLYQLPHSTFSMPAKEGIENKASQHVSVPIALEEFLEQFTDPEEIKTFGGKSRGTILTPPTVHGVNDPNRPGVEAHLDVTLVQGLYPEIPTLVWNVPGRNPSNGEEPFLTWAMCLSDAELDLPHTKGMTQEDEVLSIGPKGGVPLVHSLSYGDDELDMPPEYANRLHVEFMKAALRGMTVLVASGDSGAVGRKKTCGHARPELPAAFPFITSVGGTQLMRRYLPQCTEHPLLSLCGNELGEVACQSDKGGVITTGGGFSTLFKRPLYQEKHVENFFKTSNLPPDSFFNRLGRGYPDVSALASNILSFRKGGWEKLSGTSGSCPIVATIVVLLNRIKLSMGAPPIGFFNPLLYSLASTNPSVFNDIMVGSNDCLMGGINSECCGKESGFQATPGWDAVTGLGTINFPVLAEAVIELTRRQTLDNEIIGDNENSKNIELKQPIIQEDAKPNLSRMPTVCHLPAVYV